MRAITSADSDGGLSTSAVAAAAAISSIDRSGWLVWTRSAASTSGVVGSVMRAIVSRASPGTILQLGERVGGVLPAIRTAEEAGASGICVLALNVEDRYAIPRQSAPARLAPPGAWPTRGTLMDDRDASEALRRMHRRRFRLKLVITLVTALVLVAPAVSSAGGERVGRITADSEGLRRVLPPPPPAPVAADGQTWAEIEVARCIVGAGCETNLNISIRRLKGDRFGEAAIGSCAIAVHRTLAWAARQGRGTRRRIGIWWECTVVAHEYAHAIGLEHDVIEPRQEDIDDACEEWAMAVRLRP
jgi:hypothetical protein